MCKIEDFYRKNNIDFLESLKSVCTFTSDEWKISLLIRAGYKQKDIAKLVHKTESAIHQMRKRLLVRVNKGDAKVQEWNRIVEGL